MTDYFISDTHFGHKNIIKFYPELRPFSTIEEHDEVLIQNWNSVVKKGDRVFHLGDFAWGTANIVKTVQRLNGVKYLIMGNHDTAPTVNYLKGFHKCLGCLAYDKFILSHIPVTSDQFYRYLGNIHGHLHAKTMEDTRYFNVSVEKIGLKPISFDELYKKFQENNVVI